MESVKIIECPRDAMQGLKKIIPTDEKVDYLNALLKVGFHSLDFGSFVSPAAVPQLADTMEVLSGLHLEETQTELLVIVANEKGAQQAIAFPEIKYVGYPFSLSETFQQRNTRRSIEDSLALVNLIQDMCMRTGKELLVYLSMGFGNPYGDAWAPELVLEYAEKIQDMGVKILSLADTVGSADGDTIRNVFTQIIPAFPDLEIGAHFHSTPFAWQEKIEAAFQSGCRRFDGALKGYGGCPFAKDELTGNIPTEHLIQFLESQNINTGLNALELAKCLTRAEILMA